MKKLSVVFALSLAVCFCGCEKKEPVHKDSKVLIKPANKKSGDRSVLTTGEMDRFQPRSKVESVRKKRLTNFGSIKKRPAVITPDIDTATKAINKDGFDAIKVGILGFKPLEKSSFPFDYENDLQALKRLKNQHNLEEITKNKETELAAVRALMVYTHDFLEGGSPPPADTRWTYGPSAVNITELRREKGIGGTSEHYAALLCQLSVACGFNSRIISMHTVDENGEILSHDVCEVFLNSYSKWAVFDAYSKATYYLRDETPQSALELRNLMLDNLYKDIAPVAAIGDFTDVMAVREKVLPRYRYIYMWRMNDILGKSQGGRSIPWQALYQAHLVWDDELAPIKDGSFDKVDKFTNTDNPDYPLKGVKYVTHNKSDFYWTLNKVAIDFERTANDKIRIYIDTITPNFDFFEIRITDENKAQNYKQTGNIKDINNIYFDLLVRTFNKQGVPGTFTQVNLNDL